MGRLGKEKTRMAVETGLIGALAGLAGGIAEILWVGMYGIVSGNDMTDLAREIAAVVGGLVPPSPLQNAPVMSGIAIHMLAAIMLGIALTFAWRELTDRKLLRDDQYLFFPFMLAVIWVFNFFVLLPLLSPHFSGLHRSFTEIVPYPVSLFSKLLFGLAAAVVLTYRNRSNSLLNRVQGEISCRAI